MVEARYDAGVVSKSCVLLARSYVLECRIDLLKEEEAAKAMEKVKDTNPKR